MFFTLFKHFLQSKNAIIYSFKRAVCVIKQKLFVWQFSGFAITSFLGTLLHFVYEWTNESILVAPFSAVNESTGEHMKLFFFPAFLFSLFQNIFFKDVENYWRIKLRGITVGLILIPVLFYTYNGAFGKSPDWVNIAIFFISAAFCYITEFYSFKKHNLRRSNERICFLIILIIGLLFIVFTFATPKIPLYKDPLTETFGIC